MIKIFIVDDHDVVREGLKRIADKSGKMTVVGEADNGERAVSLLRQTSCDVLLLDINMPGVDGHQTIDRLKEFFDISKVVIYTMLKEDSTAIFYLNLGIGSFISKRNSPAQLIEAIETVAAGKRYLTPELTDFIFEHGIDLQTAPHNRFSTREYEVFRMYVSGMGATEIGKKLGITRSTVSTLLGRIKAKLGARTTADVLNYAIKHELTE